MGVWLKIQLCIGHPSCSKWILDEWLHRFKEFEEVPADDFRRTFSVLISPVFGRLSSVQPQRLHGKFVLVPKKISKDFKRSSRSVYGSSKSP